VTFAPPAICSSFILEGARLFTEFLSRNVLGVSKVVLHVIVWGAASPENKGQGSFPLLPWPTFPPW
jgi:hypothetical protein